MAKQAAKKNKKARSDLGSRKPPEEKIVPLRDGIVALMKLRKITQSKLATNLKLSRVAFNRFLRGETDLRLKDFLRVLELLGVDLNYHIARKRLELEHPEPGSLVGIGSDLEYIILRVPRVGQRSYLGLLVAYFGLIESLVPKARLERVLRDLEALDRLIESEGLAEEGLPRKKTATVASKSRHGKPREKSSPK